jgi:Uma2 family endonuclease
MADDVTFRIPGQPPMQGRSSFEQGLQKLLTQHRIESTSNIREVEVSGSLAYCWTDFNLVSWLVRRSISTLLRFLYSNRTVSSLCGTTTTMSDTANNTNWELAPKSQDGEPTWEVAHLFPVQGQWHESDFFQLHSNRMVELVEGRLAVLPMPTWLHQLIVRFLFEQLSSFVATKGGGTVLFAPLPVRLFTGTIREPDILYVAAENTPQDKKGYPERVDLVMEVVSESDHSRTRDYDEKRRDYARGGVAEYWIVDYQISQITVLTLVGDQYRDAGVYTTGQIATSLLIPGFAIEIDRILEFGK